MGNNCLFSDTGPSNISIIRTARGHIMSVAMQAIVSTIDSTSAIKKIHKVLYVPGVGALFPPLTIANTIGFYCFEIIIWVSNFNPIMPSKQWIFKNGVPTLNFLIKMSDPLVIKLVRGN